MADRNTKIQAIVFDFGGVLMDWNPRYLYRQFFNGDADAVEAFLTEIGFNEWNLEQDRGRPFSEAVTLLSSQFPHHGDLIKAYFDRWDETIAGTIPGTVEILARLKQAGLRLFGLSNWSA